VLDRVLEPVNRKAGIESVPAADVPPVRCLDDDLAAGVGPASSDNNVIVDAELAPCIGVH
jgi:hypothetical protein